MAEATEPKPIDLAAELGAEPGFSTQCITIYVPNKDRDGLEIGKQRKWGSRSARSTDGTQRRRDDPFFLIRSFDPETEP